MCVCVTRFRRRGPSKSGRPFDIELKREAKTGQQKIKKGSKDRSTQIREPDNTNPRAMPRIPIKINPCGQETHTTRRPENKKQKHHTATTRTHNSNKNKNETITTYTNQAVSRAGNPRRPNPDPILNGMCHPNYLYRFEASITRLLVLCAMWRPRCR